MIPAGDVKKALIDVLKKIFGKKYKYYGIEVSEGYEKPSFFTQMIPIDTGNETINTANSAYSFVITCFQEKIDEADALETFSKIREGYGLKVKIGNRYINVTDVDYDFVGEKRNILQVTVNVSFKDKIEKEETAPIMREIEITKKMEV